MIFAMPCVSTRNDLIAYRLQFVALLLAALALSLYHTPNSTLKWALEIGGVAVASFSFFHISKMIKSRKQGSGQPGPQGEPEDPQMLDRRDHARTRLSMQVASCVMLTFMSLPTFVVVILFFGTFGSLAEGSAAAIAVGVAGAIFWAMRTNWEKGERTFLFWLWLQYAAVWGLVATYNFWQALH